MTPRKVRALAALLATGGPVAAAKASGVPRRTLFDWRSRDPAFRAALAEALDALHRAAIGEALPGVMDALETARTTAGHPRRGVWPRLRGAELTLRAAGLIPSPDDDLRKQVRRLERRVAALEGGSGQERGRTV